MTHSLDHRHATTRRPRSLDSPLYRRVVSEYPAGYVAQLARPFSARAARRFQPGTAKRRAGAADAGAGGGSGPRP